MNPVMSTHNSTRSHYNYWPGIPPVVPLEAELTLRPYSVITTTATRLPHAIDTKALAISHQGLCQLRRIGDLNP